MISKEQWNRLKSSEHYGMYVDLRNRIDALKLDLKEHKKDLTAHRGEEDGSKL